MKPKFIDYYMKVAELTSTLSYAKRLQVGSVIVKGNKILATGYNGMPSGWDNECETVEIVEIDEKFSKQLVTKQEVLHSETNAIAKVSASTESSEGAAMFCTHAPCINCAKLIYQSGINSLYYRNTYRDTSGIEFLEKSGVVVTKYET
jgi:dCMP deaminase|tara:strand:- start:1714 stop:2157 length:444 start_codon:yes stop_codon:yes gene_type:complete